MKAYDPSNKRDARTPVIYVQKIAIFHLFLELLSSYYYGATIFIWMDALDDY
jgi:hypothetical protein